VTAAEPLAAVLHAEGPGGPHPERLDLFGRFVGAWDLDWRGTGLDGAPARAAGEVVFGWILAGTALQDVWRVPLDPAAGGMRSFHGTTVRFYDPAIDAWRSTWLDPRNGRVRRFIGRPDGDGILLEGQDQHPRERWRFQDLGPDRFRWTSETSTDGGRTWVRDEEMLARRRAG
jgi:hypothetical protein